MKPYIISLTVAQIHCVNLSPKEKGILSLKMQSLFIGDWRVVT
jgi:hypothetical protein